MFYLTFPNVFDIESSFCMEYYEILMKNYCSIEHILRNATLRNSEVNKSLYLLDLTMLVGLEEGDCEEEIEDIRQKENSFLTKVPEKA